MKHFLVLILNGQSKQWRTIKIQKSFSIKLTGANLGLSWPCFDDEQQEPWNSFQLSVESMDLLWFYFTTPYMIEKKMQPFATLSQAAFSRAWCRFFALSSHWFDLLFEFDVIGHWNCLGLTALICSQLKTALSLSLFLFFMVSFENLVSH